MITIKQIEVTNAMADAFNAGQDVPAIDVWRTMMFGVKKWKPEYEKHYRPVYEIETDDLDTAFELTNLWNNGHLVKALPGKGRSSSVGDIFEKGGEKYIVDTFGFEKIS